MIVIGGACLPQPGSFGRRGAGGCGQAVRQALPVGPLAGQEGYGLADHFAPAVEVGFDESRVDALVEVGKRLAFVGQPGCVEGILEVLHACASPGQAVGGQLGVACVEGDKGLATEAYRAIVQQYAQPLRRGAGHLRIEVGRCDGAFAGCAAGLSCRLNVVSVRGHVCIPAWRRIPR